MDNKALIRISIAMIDSGPNNKGKIPESRIASCKQSQRSARVLLLPC
jgi:hypothetical protein